MFGVVEVICKSGCNAAATGTSIWIVLGAVAAAIAVGLAYWEVRRLIRSIATGQQANAINAVSHCAQRHHEIMRDLQNEEYGVRSDDASPGGWWYRYWDLHTEQFTLFSKGLLDAAVYELWMTELAAVYNESPTGDGMPHGVVTRAVAHAAYLDKTAPQHVALQMFFRQLSGISVDVDSASRAAQVNALVHAYTPKQTSWARRVLRALRAARSPGRPDHQVLVSERAIKRRVRELATVIDARYMTEPLIVVAIMESAWVFATDLAKLLNGPVELTKIEASSYRDGAEAQPVNIGDVPRLSLNERNVLIVDDVIETGKTLDAVQTEIKRSSPKSIAICVLLSKPGKLAPKIDVKPDYVGFGSMPGDKFVVGYGIDFDSRYRDLPYISAVDESGRLLHAFPMTAVRTPSG